MEKGRGTNRGKGITRRAALAGAAAAAAAALAGCSGGDAQDKLDAAQEELMARYAEEGATLPLGSVVRTQLGAWMVVGLKPVVPGGDGDPNQCYDYEGISWPAGAMFPELPQYDCNLFNSADIAEVLYLGYSDDAERDMRSYRDSFDRSQWAGDEEYGLPERTLVDDPPCLEDQALRAQGHTAAEIYGESFDGGLLFGGLLDGYDEGAGE